MTNQSSILSNTQPSLKPSSNRQIPGSAHPPQVKGKNVRYVNGGSRERARLVDRDLANGNPKSRSRYYA